MKTLIIFGGARKKGKTMQMVGHFLERVGTEQRMLDCYSLRISPCRDCRRCQTQNACAIHDDMQQYYQLIDEADNIVFAAPVYFYSTPGPMKVFIDRLQLYWASGIRKDRGKLSPQKGSNPPERGSSRL
ncbi:MAG: flavodoxin family protein [Bacillota bacterium]